MKQTTMAFSARELDELAIAYVHDLKQRQPRPGDPGLRDNVDLLIRLLGAVPGSLAWNMGSPFEIAWVAPVIRKALRDAGELVSAREKIAELELELKAARKPAEKAKGKFPRRKRTPVRAIGPDGRFLPMGKAPHLMPGSVSAAVSSTAASTHLAPAEPVAVADGSSSEVPST